MNNDKRILIFTATYNEIENIKDLITGITKVKSVYTAATRVMVSKNIGNIFLISEIREPGSTAIIGVVFFMCKFLRSIAIS